MTNIEQLQQIKLENVFGTRLKKFQKLMRIKIREILLVSSIYDAFIVSRSFETALGIIYRDKIQVKNYKMDVFSTKGAAISWLLKFD